MTVSSPVVPAEFSKFANIFSTELYKKDLNDPDNHDGVVTHPEPDILHCEISCPEEALLWTKLVEAMEFQLSCLKS